MLIKGIILSIDANGNNCSVELPTFENVSGDKAIADAVFAIPPGESNGYKVGDVVIVGFELEKLNKPIVVGKLYTGVETESTVTGSVKCNTLRVSNSATLPGSTMLTYDSSLTNSFKKYGTIADIVSAVNTTAGKVDYLTKTGSAEKSLDVKFNHHNYSLEIYLNGFDYEDAGSKIYLFKSTRRKYGRRGYSHPANLKANSEDQAGMGYGVLAGKKRDSSRTFPALPSWMSNNGLIQTEWTITAEHIKKGYISISILKDWNALVCPNTGATPVWCNILGSGNCGTYLSTTTSVSPRRGALKIKFAYWDKFTNMVSGLTSTTFRIGARLDKTTPESLVNDSGYLRPERLYLSIQ